MVINDGLTGVVGPNGCGKSNLLEALRWVMGENRPRAMRGGGMEDVIFAGAATRPARNFAEVSLTLDNADRLAPPGFNDTDQVEINRRITRDIGSAYKSNGKDVRARDVQMLFADASTGAHSPALVRQGQISELINAKPKARRRILEEAAGISGLYQRRHEAELKLKGADANLLRVTDTVDQLSSQLAALARQARQAARYREIGEELRQAEGLLLYRRWKEADQALAIAQAELTERTKATGAAETAARQAAKARVEHDRVLPSLREEEAVAGAVLQRLVVQRDALKDQEHRARTLIERLGGQIEQLGADQERELALNKDANETISQLEWEQGEITKANEGHDAKLETAFAKSRDAAQQLQEREASSSEKTEDVARLAARHQSAARLLDETQRTLARAQNELARSTEAVSAAETSLKAAKGNLETAVVAQSIAVANAKKADEALLAAEEARAEVQGRESEARAQMSEAEGEVNALRAEVAALAKLVERDASEEEMLLDRLSVQDGFEKALGVALGDDLRAPEVVDAGRSGWAELAGYTASSTLPDGVPSLSNFVTVPPVLGRRMAQVGLVDAVDGPRLQSELQPGQRLVSTDGDMWRWDGFRVAAEDAPSAAALRLQQLNRLQSLKQDLVEATARADGARQGFETLRDRLARLTETDRVARITRRDADAAVTEANRAQSRAEAEASISAGKVESQGLSVRRFEEEVASATERLKEAQKAADDLGDLSAARDEVEKLKQIVEEARVDMMAARSAHDELRRAGEARTRRRQEIIKEVSGWKHRLETADKRISEMAARQAKSEAELKSAEAAPEKIAAKRAELQIAIETAEERCKKSADKLAEAETAFRVAEAAERAAERAASEAREARARSEARFDAAKGTVSFALERIEEECEKTPGELLETLDADPENMPQAEIIENDVNRLKRQRDALGAVNLRADEDSREISEEHENLLTERTDLEEAIKKLRTGIAGLNKEGRERLLEAFEEVNRDFGVLFPHLFGGGEAKLVMVESEDPLEAGLEIMCQPPGKKLSTLSLLSGGEQTLTALALIFAVFLANPAPICVLDEVDAPLDDANVTRFCDLLDEMTRRTNTRFMIITHHAVTMARMDRLYGVTMGEQGVSQLVSVDLHKAESLVA
ncbi:Chromosome segregation protein SMC2 [Rhodobacterales bacterium HTCC2150]|nr:Chromosome segregation protein SMC2 [Rhodobacterales bacterium HTCC2150] [Rhodobacteraceae bacterium HTCC2150]